jgi:hypothetical protein
LENRYVSGAFGVTSVDGVQIAGRDLHATPSSAIVQARIGDDLMEQPE